MMKMSNFMFLSSMMLGTLISVSAYSWFSAWIGLEINLLSFIPQMKNNKNNKYPSEAAMKYFIVQAMASTILLFAVSMSLILNLLKHEQSLSSLNLMINSSLLMKLGAAPFHFWFPEVMSGLSWMNLFILMTWQKIGPLVLLTMNSSLSMFISLIIITSSIISGIQAFNQTCLRKIMAYSSINHIGWMIASTLNSMDTWLWYFLIYSLINLNIIIMLNKMNILSISQLPNLFSFNKMLKITFGLNFLSLGGLPPFLGFLPKWLTIHGLISSNFFVMTVILMIFTLISMYVYLRITFPSFSISTDESIMINLKMKYNWYIMLNLMSIMGLLTCSFI